MHANNISEIGKLFLREAFVALPGSIKKPAGCTARAIMRIRLPAIGSQPAPSVHLGADGFSIIAESHEWIHRKNHLQTMKFQLKPSIPADRMMAGKQIMAQNICSLLRA